MSVENMHSELIKTRHNVFWHAVYKTWPIVTNVVHIVLSKFVVSRLLNSVFTLPCET